MVSPSAWIGTKWRFRTAEAKLCDRGARVCEQPLFIAEADHRRGVERAHQVGWPVEPLQQDVAELLYLSNQRYAGGTYLAAPWTRLLVGGYATTSLLKPLLRLLIVDASVPGMRLDSRSNTERHRYDLAGKLKQELERTLDARKHHKQGKERKLGVTRTIAARDDVNSVK